MGPSASPSLRLYAARSHIALLQFDKAATICALVDTPASKAVKLLADSIKAAGSDGGAAADEAFELLEELGDDADGVTRAVAGTILAAQEDYRQQAIEVLGGGAKDESQEWQVKAPYAGLEMHLCDRSQTLQCRPSCPIVSLDGSRRPCKIDFQRCESLG